MEICFYKLRSYIGLGLVVVFCAIVLLKIFVSPNPKRMSPKEIVNLYYKLRNTGDTDLLQRIVYFPPGTTERQKKAKIESILASPEEKGMMRLFGVKGKAKYEKFLDETTAEVGTVASAFIFIGKHYPGNQIILRKEDGIWKYSHIMGELPKEVLIESLRNNPEDTDLYFHLAIAYISENLAKSHRYYLKYYELAPDGFWVDEDFGKLIKEYRKEYEQTGVYEKEMLAKIDALPTNHILSKTIEYQRLCQLFMEKKDYKKANYYITLAEETLKKDRSEYNYWKKNLDKVKNELELRINGEYVDPLDEIEKNQQD